MRIALFSDIHGNSLALDAVLEDIEKQGGVDAYWILGDLVAIGPDPIGILERLTALKNAEFIRGNTDRYVVTGERPPPTIEDVRNNLEAITIFKSVNESFAWTQGAITVAGYFDFLANLPSDLNKTLPDSSQFLGVHASFELDDGIGVHPETTDEQLQQLFKNCSADLVCVGHTHKASDRQPKSLRIVNLGSVSNPPTEDLRASYVLLDANEAAYKLQHYKVSYDYAAFIAQCQQLRHPATEFIKGHYLK